MFGIQRPSSSYRAGSNLKYKNDNTNPSMSKNITNIIDDDIYNSNKFIFYDDNKKFTSQMEIYIRLNNYKNKKNLVIIDSDSNMEELRNQIRECFENYPEFKNLNGLRAENIYKIANDSKVYLPKKGLVKENIVSGDILYCDLFSNEYWIKVIFNISTFEFKKIIKLDYKLKKKMKYKILKQLLIKIGLELFIENMKILTFQNCFNYYVKFFEFIIKKKKKIFSHKQSKYKNNEPIDKIVDFNSEILVDLKFGIFEELVHSQLKINDISKENRLRMGEYSDLLFEDLISDEKFRPELNTIKEISREFLITQHTNKNPNFLFYTKKIHTFNDEYSFLYKKDENVLDFDDEEDEEEEEEDDDDLDITSDNNINNSSNNINNSNINNSNINDSAIKINKIIKTKKPTNQTKKEANMILVVPFLNKYNNNDNNNSFERNKERKSTFENDINVKHPKLSIDEINSIPSSVKQIEFDKSNLYHLMNEKDEEDIDITNKKVEAELQTSTKTPHFGRNSAKNIFGSFAQKINTTLKEFFLDNNEGETIDDKNYNDNYIYENTFDNNAINNNILVDNDKKNDLYHRRSSFIGANKMSIFAVLRTPIGINLCDELKSVFNYEEFLQYLKKYFKYLTDKKSLNRIKIPESKDLEYLDKVRVYSSKRRRFKTVFRNKEVNISIGGLHIYIFIGISLLYFIILLLCLNLNFADYILEHLS